MIKLVVFDWNGVLIADAQACADTVSRILRRYGRPAIDLKTYQDVYEIPVKNMYRKLGFTETEIKREATHIQDMFHERYEPRIAHVRTRTGARGLLKWLSKQNIECTIFSNHTTEGVQYQLKRLQVASYFSHVLANDKYQAMNGQTKGDRLKDFLADRRFKKKEILIIGDSAEEVMIGKHLGLATIAITGGHYSAARLRKARPDHLIHTLADVINIIEMYNPKV